VNSRRLIIGFAALCLTSGVMGQRVEMIRTVPSTDKTTGANRIIPLTSFVAEHRKNKIWLTGPGMPMKLGAAVCLPVYAEIPPPLPYQVLGYVRVSCQPAAANYPRWTALQSAADVGKSHGGDALYLVPARSGDYLTAAVLKW
jgi:hypothetical protein